MRIAPAIIVRVFYGSELISKNQYDELMLDVEEMYRILTASIKTAKSKLK